MELLGEETEKVGMESEAGSCLILPTGGLDDLAVCEAGHDNPEGLPVPYALLHELLAGNVAAILGGWRIDRCKVLVELEPQLIQIDLCFS